MTYDLTGKRVWVAGHWGMLVTELNAFRSLDVERIKSAMLPPIFVDVRDVYPQKEVEAAVFAYHTVGRLMAHEAYEHSAAAE